MILRVSMIGMELDKGMLKEIDYSSFVIKRSCVWQRHGLQRRNRENSIQYGWK